METTKFKAGTNVYAKIDGKEIGPIYLVQIHEGIATLQCGETYTVPISDLLESPSPSPAKAKEVK